MKHASLAKVGPTSLTRNSTGPGIWRRAETYRRDEAGVVGMQRRMWGATTSGTRALAANPSKSRKSRRSR